MATKTSLASVLVIFLVLLLGVIFFVNFYYPSVNLNGSAIYLKDNISTISTNINSVIEKSFLDFDKDGVKDEFDNCVFDVNPLQEDSDDDGIGDVCDIEKRHKNDDKGECERDSDCGEDGFVGDLFCYTNDVYQNYKEFDCKNAGDEDSYCSDETSSHFIEDCGVDSCGDFGDDYCVGDDVYHSRVCYNKGCLLGACFSSDYDDEKLVEECLEGCVDRDCADCTPGETEQCGLSDVGECEYGVKTCSLGGVWGSCVGAVYPVDEICEDGLDNDCDGEIDEGCEDDCPGADYVFEVDMTVCGEGCYSSCPSFVSESVNVSAGRYEVKGKVERGGNNYCQTNEDFFLGINGEVGPETEDDAEPCATTTRIDDLGVFNFDDGLNEIVMHSASSCPPDKQANSVDLVKVCLYVDF